jgi:hypothetical protein
MWAPVAAEPEAPVIEAMPEPMPEPAPEPMPPPPMPSPPPPTPLVSRERLQPTNRLALILGWVGSFVVIAGLIVAALVWRDPVMQAWPPSIRVYAALGLTAHP